jgi:hypothetical protein
MRKETNKEIQEILLTHYLFAIEAIKDLRKEKAYRFLSSIDTESGICYLLARNEIGKGKWIDSARLGKPYWGDTPLHSYFDCKPILPTLQLRVEILQKLLLNNKPSTNKPPILC